MAEANPLDGDQPKNPADKDKELAEVQAANEGIVIGDGEPEVVDENFVDDPEDPPEEPEKPAEKPKEGDAPEEDDDEPEPEEDPEEDPEEEGEDDEDPEDDDPDEEPSSPDPDGTPRKHIPIRVWKEKKQKWRDEKKALQDEITRLQQAGTPAQDDKALDAVAEKTGIEKATLVELRKALVPEDFVKRMNDAAQTVEATRQRAEAERTFERNFSKDVLPAIRKRYPNATPRMIEKAKDKLFKLAHTERNTGVDIGILFRGVEEFDTILNAPKKKTAETARPGATETQAAPEGGTKAERFAAIHKMEPDARSRAISRMNATEWNDFIAYTEKASGQDGVIVTRKGRKVRLSGG